jgi:hypothetical protein
MSNFIVKQASDFKLVDFFSSFQNYVPSSLYNKDWYVELKKIISIIKKNNANDKYDLTDSRIVLIAYKCLEKVETPGKEFEWFVAKNYAETYSGKEQKSKDLIQFINQYIGYNFTSAEKDEKAKTIESKLKNSLYSFLESGELELPKFIKKQIEGEIVFGTKPDIEFAPTPAVDVAEDNAENEIKEIKKQLAFAVMMFEDEITTKNEKEQWNKRIKMLNLLLT